MHANEYQEQAARTLIAEPDSTYTGNQIMLVWNALGLVGEAGEVADMIKKAVFHRHDLSQDELVKELGDVLWYVAALCTKLDVSMADVMERNIAKLKQRYPNGYASADSKARVDVAPNRCWNCSQMIDDITTHTAITMCDEENNVVTVGACCMALLFQNGYKEVAVAR